jgi:sugar phosphate permease
MDHPLLLRPSLVRYQVLAVACSLAVLTYVQRQGFVAATPYIKNDLGLDDEQMGSLASVWLVAYGLFQVPGGLLGDRLGARDLLALLVLGWSLTAGAVALTAGLPPGSWLAFAALVVLRFLFGMFQGGGFPGLARVIADWVPQRQRGQAQGMVWTFSRLGGFLAPLLVVWLITGVFHGWTAPLWFLAGLGVVWCALFWLWFRNRPEDHPGVNAGELAVIRGVRPALAELSIEAERPASGASTDILAARTDVVAGERAFGTQTAPTSLEARPPELDEDHGHSHLNVPWLKLMGNRNVWALCLTYGFMGFAGNFITSLLNIYLHDHRHLTDSATAWVSGLPLAFGIVSCLLGGVLSDWLIRRTGSRKWGRRLVGFSSFLLAALACLSVIWAGEVWLLALAFSAWFFFNDAAMGPAWASCADVGERYTGTLSGAMNMTGAFLGAVGMWLAGRLLKAGQGDLVFIIFAGSYVLGSLCWLAVDVTKPLVARDHRVTA